METLAVSPKDAWAALGIGKTKGWELVARGDLQTFKIDGATRITAQSIREYMAGRLAEQQEAA